MQATEMTAAELAKIHTEIAKLMAETSKLNAEAAKFQIERLKISRELFWYPVAIAVGLLGAATAGAALVLKVIS